jgi:hypothetical protein
MIVTWLCGGLGNQMFQYAAGLALAERHRTVLKLDVSWFRADPAHAAHNRYALSAWNITEQFATAAELDAARGVTATRTERWAAGAARSLRLYRWAAQLEQPGRVFRVDAPSGDPAGLAAQPDGTYLSGMWQDEAHFASIAPLLRLHFTARAPRSTEAQRMAARIAAASAAGGAVAVHLRLGDYASNPRFARELGPVGPGYYAAALAKVRARAPQAELFIFSDDARAAAAAFPPDAKCHHYAGSSPWHAYEEIELIAACDHAVLSNSTFAWWGAWLRGGGPEQRLVTVPEPWFVDPALDGARLAPRDWTRISRHGS